MKKVPLTIYKDGQRIVIGEAVVDNFAEGYVGVIVTDPKFNHILKDRPASFSIGPIGETIEVSAVPTFKSPVRESYLAEYYRKNPPKTE